MPHGGVDNLQRLRGIDKFIQHKCECLLILISSSNTRDFRSRMATTFSRYPVNTVKIMGSATLSFVSRTTPSGKPLNESVVWRLVESEERLDIINSPSFPSFQPSAANQVVVVYNLA